MSARPPAPASPPAPNGSAPAVAWDTTAVPDGWTNLVSGADSTGMLVLNGPAVEGGRLDADAGWDATRVRVVRDDVVVPAGSTLSIGAGTVVKFVPGSRLVAETDASILADGAHFADFADDSVGGDTNLDGDSSAPSTDWPDWTESTGGLVRVEFFDGAAAAFPARAYTVGRLLGTLPAPAREGSRFAGWRTAPDGGGEAVSPDTPVSAELAALHADWTPLSLELSPASTNLPAVGASVAIAVAANAPWSASADAGWIVLRLAEGDGDSTLEFDVSANRSETPRSATVRVAVEGGVPARGLTVTQDAMKRVAAPVIVPADGTVFQANAQRVAIRCGTVGADVRYTLDGSDPSESSPRCSSDGFNVFDTATVKARAFADGMLPSAVVSARLVRLQTLAEALGVPLWTVTTDGDADWLVDAESSSDASGSSARSGPVGHDQSSSLRASVEGSGTLAFRWKTSCEDDPDDTWTWDCLSFAVDGLPVAHVDGRSPWTDVEMTLGPGSHALVWTFATDYMDGTDPGEKCGWVDHLSWTPTVVSGDAAIPVSWFEEQGLLPDGASPETAAGADPDADGMTTAEEYVAGTDPSDPDSVFFASLDVSGASPRVAWEPDLGTARRYRVLARKEMTDSGWTDVTDHPDPAAEGYRFFAVTVESSSD